MNKLILTAVTSFSLISLMTSSSAYAFNNAGTVTLSAAGGYDYFSGKRKVENTGVGFGIVGYNFTDNWGIEGLFGLFNTNSRNVATYNQDVKGKIFAFDVAYHFSPYKQLQPFIIAGPGILGFTPNGPDADYSGNLNAGVGADLFFGNYIALRAEARDFYTFIGGKNDVMLDGGVTFFINT